jgi:Fe-S-cluster containining protein
MAFECTQCGLCCKNLKRTLSQEPPMKWMAEIIKAFPYETKEDGSCEKLVGNKCSVYEDRPMLCNIEKTADEVDTGMSKKQWFDRCYRGCESLQMEIL